MMSCRTVSLRLNAKISALTLSHLGRGFQPFKQGHSFGFVRNFTFEGECIVKAKLIFESQFSRDSWGYAQYLQAKPFLL